MEPPLRPAGTLLAPSIDSSNTAVGSDPFYDTETEIQESLGVPCRVEAHLPISFPNENSRCAQERQEKQIQARPTLQGARAC